MQRPTSTRTNTQREGGFHGLWIGIVILSAGLMGCQRQQEPVARARHEPVNADSLKLAPAASTRLDRNASTTAVFADRFPATNLPVYELRIDPKDLRAMEQDPDSDTTYPAIFIADGEVYDGAQVRFRGQWARSWPKKPFKVFFSRAKPFQGHHSVNLNSAWRDPALVREALAYHVFAVCGVPASRSRMVRLHVNQEFSGLYVEVEQVDKPFLRRAQLRGAALFKATSANNQADERDLGSLRSFARHYEEETRRTNELQALQAFCHELAVATNILEFFTRQVDLERYINYLAASVLVQHWDGFNKNHFLVRDTRGSGKWLVLPWDLDRTLGDHWHHTFDRFNLAILLGTQPLPGPTGWNRMQERFLSEPALRLRFLNRLEELLEKEFTTARLFPILDQFAVQLGPAAVLDRQRWPGPAEDFQQGIAGLKTFIERRRAFLQKETKRLKQNTPP